MRVVWCGTDSLGRTLEYLFLRSTPEGTCSGVTDGRGNFLNSVLI